MHTVHSSRILKTPEIRVLSIKYIGHYKNVKSLRPGVTGKVDRGVMKKRS